MALLWILVIAGSVWLVLTLARPQRQSGGGDSALRILQERLAHGEIDAEEFRSRRAVIEERAG